MKEADKQPWKDNYRLKVVPYFNLICILKLVHPSNTIELC